MHPTVYSAFRSLVAELTPRGRVLEVGALPDGRALIAMPELSHCERIGINLAPRHCAHRMYFTAFIDESVDGYVEKDPDRPRNMSSQVLIKELLSSASWRIEAVHAPSLFQQAAFVCSARRG